MAARVAHAGKPVADGPTAYLTAGAFVPRGTLTLPVLRRAAAAGRGCDLYARATQTVFGEGPTSSHVMMVGEVPGDREDIAAPVRGSRGGAASARQRRRRCSGTRSA